MDKKSSLSKIYAKVDCESCIACGICQLRSPEIFEYDAEGIAFVKQDQNTTRRYDRILQGGLYSLSNGCYKKEKNTIY